MGKEKCIYDVDGESWKTKDNLEDLVVGGRIILKYMFKKCDGMWRCRLHSSAQDREMRVISSLIREVIASDEGLCCTELMLCEQCTDHSNRASRPALGPAQPPVQTVQGAIPQRKAAGE
jgi:hypothetical protein